MPSRRSFLQSAGLASAALCARRILHAEDAPAKLLNTFSYGDVHLAPGPAQKQFEQTQSVLMSLNNDSLLKPWRLRAGLPAPGPEMGGWYDEVPLQRKPSGGHGFAPGHSFGQWISALSRAYAINGDPEVRAKVNRLLALYSPAISGRFYANFRFPAYDYDKMVIGLLDAHRFANIPDAFDLLNRTTDAAQAHLPPRALDRGAPQRQWRASVGDSTADDYTWDEPYTLPENLYLAAQHGAGQRYQQMAGRYLLDETYFDPLSRNENVLPDHHAYSFCNALSSAMQCYISTGSQKHLRAAHNASAMITETQSFATGGWGPNESFVSPGSGALYASLSKTHHSFETPCGSYAHCKLTRYLLQVTADGRYGDSMERVIYNTVLGAKPLQPDGRAFYYSDYNTNATRTYFPDKWPCCSGTLPQIAADYRILTYFHDVDGVCVNLYFPSTVRWTTPNGAQLALTQSGNYPSEGKIAIKLKLSRPSQFGLRLRIPAWSGSAKDAAIRVNGVRVPAQAHAGFATLRREWKDGDEIQFDLPMPMRLEAIDAQHPNSVALMRGPLALFVAAGKVPPMPRKQLLAARKLSGQTIWQVETTSVPVRMMPFTELGDQAYSLYLQTV